MADTAAQFSKCYGVVVFGSTGWACFIVLYSAQTSKGGCKRCAHVCVCARVCNATAFVHVTEEVSRVRPLLHLGHAASDSSAASTSGTGP